MPTIPDEAALPVPIPQPAPGPGGLKGWVVSHVRPFANSLAGFASSGELDKVVHVALASGTVAGFVATLLVGLAPVLQDASGPLFGPFVGLAATSLAGYIGLRAKMTDNTDGAGKRVRAEVVKDPGANPPP